MSSPTDLLTTAITNAVREAVHEELAPVIARLEKAENTPMTSPDELLTTAQVADLIGVAKSTLSYWRTQGSGPEYQRMGKAIRYRRRDINTWITDTAA